MAYRPPHMRRSAPSTASPGQASSSSHTSSSTSQRQPRPGPSRFTINRSSTSSLQAPAGDIKPNRRFQNDKPLDEMELLQSVSRSGGDGAEGDALKDWAMQERYRRYIEDRLDKHYDNFKTPRHTPPSPTASEELASLSSIVLLFRKLREGVVASHRVDHFAIEVFEASARISILAQNTAQLISSLSGLIPGLYTLVGKGKSRSIVKNDLSNGLRELRLSEKDSRMEMVSLLLLFHLVHTDSRSTYHDTLIDLTQPIRRALRSSFTNTSNDPLLASPMSFIQVSQVDLAVRAARYLSPETFNPLAYFALLEDPGIGRYEKIVLSWSKEKVRDTAWLMVGRAYVDCPLGWVVAVCGLERDCADEWVERKLKAIVDGRIKLR